MIAIATSKSIVKIRIELKYFFLIVFDFSSSDGFITPIIFEYFVMLIFFEIKKSKKYITKKTVRDLKVQNKAFLLKNYNKMNKK